MQGSVLLCMGLHKQNSANTILKKNVFPLLLFIGKVTNGDV